MEIVHITLKGGRVAVCMDYFLASLCFIDLAILLLVKVQCVWVGIWWVIFRYMGWLVDIEVLKSQLRSRPISKLKVELG